MSKAGLSVIRRCTRQGRIISLSPLAFSLQAHNGSKQARFQLFMRELDQMAAEFEDKNCVRPQPHCAIRFCLRSLQSTAHKCSITPFLSHRRGLEADHKIGTSKDRRSESRWMVPKRELDVQSMHQYHDRHSGTRTPEFALQRLLSRIGFLLEWGIKLGIHPVQDFALLFSSHSLRFLSPGHSGRSRWRRNSRKACI